MHSEYHVSVYILLKVLLLLVVGSWMLKIKVDVINIQINVFSKHRDDRKLVSLARCGFF